MDTFDATNQRRSVKAFDPAHRFTASEETQRLVAAMQSPTSFNMQNWRFVVVRDTELRKQAGLVIRRFLNEPRTTATAAPQCR